jgi:hypothetical protein
MQQINLELRVYSRLRNQCLPHTLRFYFKPHLAKALLLALVKIWLAFQSRAEAAEAIQVPKARTIFD